MHYSLCSSDILFFQYHCLTLVVNALCVGRCTRLLRSTAVFVNMPGHRILWPVEYVVGTPRVTQEATQGVRIPKCHLFPGSF